MKISYCLNGYTAPPLTYCDMILYTTMCTLILSVSPAQIAPMAIN